MRKVISIFVVLMMVCLMCSILYAADLKQIISNAKNNFAEFEKEVKDMTVKQEMKMITPAGQMTTMATLYKKGDKFRTDAKMNMPKGMEGMGSMENVIIYNGKDTWMISPFMGKSKINDEEAMQYQTQRNWWNFISNNAKIIDEEAIEGTDCYVINNENNDNLPFDKMWLEKNTLVLVKAEGKGMMGENISIINSDFRNVGNNWRMPYKTEMYANGKLITIAKVLSIDKNTGVSDSLFDPDTVKVQQFNLESLMKQDE